MGDFEIKDDFEIMGHYASKREVILIKQVLWDWAIEKLHGSHRYWTSWSALNKGGVVQLFTVESENR